MHLESLWLRQLRNSLAVICQILIIAIRKKEIAYCTAAGQVEKRRSGVKNEPASRHARMCGLMDLATSSIIASFVMYFPFSRGGYWLVYVILI
jgi:hypothetical protein